MGKIFKKYFFQELQYMFYSLYCNKDCYITIKRPRTAVTGIIYAYSAFFMLPHFTDINIFKLYS